jgi:molybdenum cofactor guanylyltransferase
VLPPLAEGLLPPLRGLVLAGGRSRRMGRDKWALSYGGERQVERAAALLAPFVSSVHLSCRPDQRAELAPTGLPLVIDRHEDRGPIEGIAAALDAHPGSAWLVVACDLPLLDRSTLEALVRGREHVRPATALLGPAGEPEPLCAIYEPAARTALNEAIARGELSPLRVLCRLETARVRPPAPGALTNVNRPEEYDRALQHLSGIDRQGDIGGE